MTDKAKPIRVGLLWHSLNSSNLGVTALTISNITLLNDAAREAGRSVEFVILGWHSPAPLQADVKNLTIKGISPRKVLDPRALYRWVRQCDIVLDISAGDSFADIYGAKRFLVNVLAKLVVVLARKPLILSPQTIGPFKAGWTSAVARLFLRKAKTVFSRDKMSTDYAHSLGCHTVIEACDVAFALPWTQQPKRDDGITRVGLNVSGLLFNGGYAKKNDFALKADYATLMRKLIAAIMQKPNTEVHLIGHVIDDNFAVEDDYRVAQALEHEFKGAIVAPKFANPSEAKSYISSLDFFSGSRMHACIASFSSGVPVIPLAYSRKFLGLFGTIGYDDVVDCKEMSEDASIQKVLEGLDQRGQLKQKVDLANARAQEKLSRYRSFLTSTLLEYR
jgi:colanic acid/amylovoran biosynthesis protein